MKEQLIEMGFVESISAVWVKYELEDCVIWARFKDGLVEHEDSLGNITTIAHNATIEQISNILKSIQI
jgi:hypothetical protein